MQCGCGQFKRKTLRYPRQSVVVLLFFLHDLFVVVLQLLGRLVSPEKRQFSEPKSKNVEGAFAAFQITMGEHRKHAIEMERTVAAWCQWFGCVKIDYEVWDNGTC